MKRYTFFKDSSYCPEIMRKGIGYGFKTFIAAFFILMSMAAVSCTTESFDPAVAQQQMKGTWKYEEESASGGTPQSCQMQVSSEGESGLKLGNIACSGLTVIAVIESETSLTIPRQTVNGDIFEGSGTIKKYKTMVLNFTYDNGREKVNIVANCTKQ